MNDNNIFEAIKNTGLTAGSYGHIADALYQDIVTNHPGIHHHILQRLKDQLYKTIMDRRAVAAETVNVSYNWYTSFKIVPTRNQRRKKRRYAEFTDQHGTTRIRRMTMNTPVQFEDWCKRQVGEKAGFVDLSLSILPASAVQVYKFTVTQEKATRK